MMQAREPNICNPSLSDILQLHTDEGIYRIDIMPIGNFSLL